MQYVFTNEENTVSTSLLNEGAVVSPDEDKYSWYLRDASGTLLFYQEEQFQEGDIKDILQADIPVQYNTKEPTDLFSMRMVEFKYKLEGVTRRIAVPYKVIDPVMLTGVPQDVRDVYGLNSGECPDETIDLIDTYLRLKSKHGNIISNALSANSILSIKTNRLVVLYSALYIFNSLRLRAPQEEGDNTIKFVRFSRMDWDALKQGVLDEIDSIESELINNDTNTEVSLGIMGTRPDIITGEE